MEQEQAYLAALEAVNGYLWEESRQDDGSFSTQGKLFYILPDGGNGVMNLTTSP